MTSPLIHKRAADCRRLRWTAPLAAAMLVCAPALPVPVWAQAPASKAPRSLAIPTTTPPASQGQGQGQGQPAAKVTPELRANYDKAFQATLEKPSDPDTLARFAGLAVQVGDIEGAISALERLLLIDGSQPDVKLELGVLYYRLGSKEAALTYLEAARASPEATPQVRDRAEAFLKAARR